MSPPNSAKGANGDIAGNRVGRVYSASCIDALRVIGDESIVSVSAWHLEPRRVTPDHCVHGERGGGDLQGSEGLARALAVDQRLDCLREPAVGRVLGAAPLVDLVDVSRLAASDGAAVRRFGCSAAWAAA